MSEIENGYSNPIAGEVAIDSRKKRLIKGKLRRYLFALLGTITLALAILGILVPGLPCTPFALLSAFLFAKSSDRLHKWLLDSKIFGNRIKSYQRRKGLTKRDKIRIILLMWTMVLTSSLIIVKIPTVKIIILVAGFIGMLVVWLIVPNSRQSID